MDKKGDELDRAIDLLKKLWNSENNQSLSDIVSINADNFYFRNIFSYKGVSREIFDVFSDLDRDEELNLALGIDSKDRLQIYKVLKPRMEKLVRLVIQTNYKKDLMDVEFPAEALALFDETYHLVWSSLKNKVNSKNMRQKSYDDFIEQYMDFVRIDADMAFHKHRFGIVLRKSSLLRVVIKFFVQHLIKRYIDEEAIKDAYMGTLFDNLRFVYEDSHVRKQNDANRGVKTIKQQPVLQSSIDENIDILALPNEQLQHIQKILIFVDQAQHKRFIKYMTKVFYNKQDLRLQHLVMRYMPHIQIDQIMPRYDKAVKELWFKKDISLDAVDSWWVIRQTIEAMRDNFTKKENAVPQIPKQYVHVDANIVDMLMAIEKNPKLLTTDILMQLLHAQGYHFINEKNFRKQAMSMLDMWDTIDTIKRKKSITQVLIGNKEWTPKRAEKRWGKISYYTIDSSDGSRILRQDKAIHMMWDHETYTSYIQETFVYR